jgi:hypothetical protein
VGRFGRPTRKHTGCDGRITFLNLCGGGDGPPVDMRSNLTFSKRTKSNRHPGSSLMFSTKSRQRNRHPHPGSNLMFSLGRIQWKMSIFGVKLNTCFQTNCVGVVHDQGSSPLRFLMAFAPPAEDGAELNRVVFVRLKDWFYEV